ncbi:BMP family ABC transporter substrate-binding protein [Priestia flexa]|uniref:BMP family ABC transporter substrate-binding protein n=1 Tax=Priestia flexa TaxID=86664 RepID=UPI00203C9091|nr:BMP family ABC transporter substrate-binding protein [Priestia flexa]MCM3068069.1 BMP family ABC transporter substrate-binding protein [Priestia flexa]
MEQAKQSKIIIFIAVLFFFILFAVIMLKAQGILHNQGAEPDEKKHVAILTSDVIVDQSWGSLAYKGKVEIENEFPVIAKVYSQLDSKQKIQNAVQAAVEEKAEVIIGHGREFSPFFNKLATSYPDVHFVTIHGTAEHSNQTVYTFDQYQTEYEAGVAASFKTSSNKVGLIDAFEAREKNKGFENGLMAANQNIEFFYRVVNSRDDSKKAVELMNELVDQGVDVIYTKGNSYNRDIISVAKEKGIYVIGYLDDQSYMGESQVLTSVINDVPQSYRSIMEDYFSESGLPSGTVVLDENDGVYRLAPFGPMYTEKEKSAIEDSIEE